MSAIYKISATRGISHHSTYDIDIYSGSSYNRKATETTKKDEEKTGFIINEFGVYEEQSRYDQRQIDANTRTVQQLLQERRNVSSPLSGMQRSGTDLSNGIDKDKTVKKHCLSARSKDKIKNKIQSLYRCCPGSKFTFLTLGFINDISDKDGAKCLNKFLTVARKKYGKFSYIWVAERQADTGRIHFHIITDRRFYIPHFNALWVLQQYNAGLSLDGYTLEEIQTRYAVTMRLKEWSAIKDNKAGTMGEILNPFDIKPIKSIEGLTLYLTAYVTKNNNEFECSNWHCCRTISKLFTTQIISAENFDELKDKAKNFRVNVKTGEVYECKTYVTDYAVIVNILNNRYYSKFLSGVDSLNKWILAGMGKTKVPSINFVDYDFIYNNAANRDFQKTAIQCERERIPKQVLIDLKKYNLFAN